MSKREEMTCAQEECSVSTTSEQEYSEATVTTELNQVEEQQSDEHKKRKKSILISIPILLSVLLLLYRAFLAFRDNTARWINSNICPPVLFDYLE